MTVVIVCSIYILLTDTFYFLSFCVIFFDIHIDLIAIYKIFGAHQISIPYSVLISQNVHYPRKITKLYQNHAFIEQTHYRISLLISIDMT